METKTRRDHGAGPLIRKLWSFCNVLRDDGLSYPDYVEQLTYLLFLKMSDEQPGGPVPPNLSWGSFYSLDAAEMHAHYTHILASLGACDGMLGVIFRNARNKVRDPAKLRLLIIDLIGQTEWTGLATDLKGDAYEGLLEKNARDTKSGAGQYFTPRALVEAMVVCANPQAGEALCDPACGTGGFLLAAHAHTRHKRQGEASHTLELHGVELVEEVARLATMNLLLHGVTSQAAKTLPISCADSLMHLPTIRFDVVLTNPPFGVKGSVNYGRDHRIQGRNDELAILRADFWVSTANKQLNFLQHVYSILKPGGRAAVVVPDNVLFEAGAAAAVRRGLLRNCEVHTLLRLPAGIFYAQGIKANVLFFRKNVGDVLSEDRELWVYSLRSAARFSVKTNPLRTDDLAEFVQLYSSRPKLGSGADDGQSRWRTFKVSDLLRSSDSSLDLLRDEAEPSPDAAIGRLEEIAEEIGSDLRRALALIHSAVSKPEGSD